MVNPGYWGGYSTTSSIGEARKRAEERKKRDIEQGRDSYIWEVRGWEGGVYPIKKRSIWKKLLKLETEFMKPGESPQSYLLRMSRGGGRTDGKALEVASGAVGLEFKLRDLQTTAEEKTVDYDGYYAADVEFRTHTLHLEYSGHHLNKLLLPHAKRVAAPDKLLYVPSS